MRSRLSLSAGGFGATFRCLAVAGVAAFSATAPNAAPLTLPTQDQLIEILCVSTEGCGKFTGTTADGTIFTAAPNPSQPSTGTGVFQPFVRIQRSTGSCNGTGDCIDVGGTKVNTENGFNTDAKNPDVNFNTKEGKWTRSVLMSEFEILPGGYILLSLDANQLGKPGTDINKILITEMQIFIGPGLANPEASNTGIEGTGYDGTLFYDGDGNPLNDTDTLLGLAPRWTLDNGTNKNVDVLLQAAICDSNGQCGSGHGDLNVFIPVSRLGAFSPTDNFVFYSEYLHTNDGFEEWKFQDAPGQQVPEPGTLGLLGLALAGFGALRRRPLRSRSGRP